MARLSPRHRHRRAALSGYAIDDGAALVFARARLDECVASRAGARVIRVAADGGGGVVEREMAVKLLPGVGASDPSEAQPDEVAELRALRAGRHRWD